MRPDTLSQPNFQSPEEAQAFADWTVSFANRPLDAFLTWLPWSEPGSILEHRRPEDWQIDYLLQLQQDMLAHEPEELAATRRHEVFNQVYKYSCAAGHGVGKTFLVAFLLHWWASTHPMSQTVVTASTQKQLDTKTWRELKKIQTLIMNGWMFEWTATMYRHRGMPELWFVAAIPWSESNPDAFAGTHEKYVMMLFDEASGIAPIIWETAEGAMTTGTCMFLVFGNPMEAEGGFFDTHHKFRKRWRCFNIDARSVSFANLKQINEWLEDHDEDSDFIRSRVRGVFPKQAANQFIEYGLVLKAQKTNIDWRDVPRSVPKLMGVDVARQGADKTVIVCRQGRKMHSNITRIRSRDLMVVAAAVARAINQARPDVVFVDGVGVGAGVVDRLHQLGYVNVIEVQSGSKDGMTDRERKVHANMRSLMWERMRDWLYTADIPPDEELATDLTGPTFSHQKRTNLQLIEDKDSMRARGLASPDSGDALSCTFWELVPTRVNANRATEPDVV